ncbi:hypothetical protein SA3033_04155 [Aggregatibacter actinomycetemcomitans serotype d str. SA3033]|nr:hypothetical protein SA2876_03615 [Aggregatibacter actinomycetemcomitans serotype e str. SA2876]KYK84181.1 hypothetical protein SA3033_04155 [Aggregatibacter actinomycetemcomitans serotype d str. SA3033]KYK88277.1 hypothetical protein SA2200_04770 [Aggregatibacter actinomycetemcomitans serotype d str. SA2200]KYK88851.1 hypothetical protein SC29R_01725 [Aggregatibacter actinomycetemcomitans serotype f str. SC29R]KYK92434.1 hypothetical protein SA269_06950 [Aggregatibacter actinomycetemcomitan
MIRAYCMQFNPILLYQRQIGRLFFSHNGIADTLKCGAFSLCFL